MFHLGINNIESMVSTNVGHKILHCTYASFRMTCPELNMTCPSLEWHKYKTTTGHKILHCAYSPFRMTRLRLRPNSVSVNKMFRYCST